MNSKKIYQKYLKRLLDILLSLMAIIILLPIIIIISILVKIKLGCPIFFKSQRPGLNEKIFTMYKFRSMIDKKDSNGKLLPDSERLTKFGKILRSTSLDELPELFNILKGDMSIVGPRPLSSLYLPYYNVFEKRRHNVRPGLTGLAQINGRTKITWDKKLYYDIEYVDNISFLNDFKIIFLTFIKVFMKSGISEPNEEVDFHEYRKSQLLKNEEHKCIKK